MGAETAEIKAEEKVDLKNGEQEMDLESLKAVIEQNTVESEYKIQPEEFIKKYEGLLKSNYQAYIEVLKNAVPLGILSQTDKLIEIGKLHMENNDPEKAFFILDAVHEGGKKLQDIRIDEIEGKIEPMTDEYSQAAYTRFFNKLGEAANKILSEQFEKNPYKHEINDKTLLNVIDRLNSESEDVQKRAEHLILLSKEKPIENIAIFMEAIRTISKKYHGKKREQLLTLLVRRGAEFMKEDKQTEKEVNRLIENPEYKKIHEILKKAINEAEEIKTKSPVNALRLYADIMRLNTINLNEVTIRAIMCATEVINDGIALMKKGEREKALDLFNEVLTVFPENPTAIFFASKCYFKKSEGDIEGPPDPNVSKLNEKEFEDLLGTVTKHMRMGQFKEARISLTVLNEQSPGNPVIIHALCLCCAKLAEQEQFVAIEKINKELEEIKKIENTELIPTIEMPGKISIKEPAIKKTAFDAKLHTIPLYTKEQAGKFSKLSKLKENLGKASLPHLTNNLKYAKETLEYRKMLKQSKFGENLVDETRITADAWNAFKIAHANIQYYLRNANKPTLPEKEKKELAEFDLANAELLSDIYPKRKSSFWDFYKVDLNADKRGRIEEKEGIPVKRNKKERVVSMQERFSPMQELQEFMNLTKDTKLKKAVGELIEVLYTFKEIGESKASDKDKKEKKKEENSDKFKQPRKDKLKEKTTELIKDITPVLKKEITRVGLEGGKSEEWKTSAGEILQLISNETLLLNLAEAAPTIEEMEWIEEVRKQEGMPEQEYGEEVIDVKPELNANLMSLDYYLDAIESDPKNIDNYIRFAYFLDKIDFFQDNWQKFESCQDLVGYIRSIGEKDPQKIRTLIKSMIGMRISEIIKEYEPKSLLGGPLGLDQYQVTQWLTPLQLIPKKVQKVVETVEMPGYERKKIKPKDTRQKGFNLHIGITRPYLAHIDTKAPINAAEPYSPTGGDAILESEGGQIDTSGFMFMVSAPPAELMRYIIWKISGK